MDVNCRSGWERRLFKAGCLLFLVALYCGPSTAISGFYVWPPPAEQALDGQTTDWINITRNSIGVGVGTLYGGVVNVGVEGLTLSGDLSINNGGLLDADRVDGGGSQYSGTINVGQRLEMVNGGRLTLNADALNILGYGTTDGTFNVYSESTVTTNDSSILGAATVRVVGNSSRFSMIDSTLGFHDELWVADGAVLNDTGSTIGHDDSIGQSDWERADIIVVNGAAVNLNGSTVDTTGGTGGVLKVENSTFSISSGNLDLGGVLQVQGGSLVELTNSDVDAENLWVEHDGSKVEITGGSLNARTNIGIGNIGSPTGSLVLHGTTVTTGDLSVLGRLIADGSDIAAGARFGGYGQGGTAVEVALTDSSLSANWIDFNQSQHNYQNSTLTARESIWYSNSTVSQTGGETVFADEMVLNPGTTMSVQGTASDHAVVRHQAAAGAGLNRGTLWIDNAILSLQDTDFDVTSGNSGEIQVRNGGNLTVTDSYLASKATNIDESSQVGLTRSTLQTGYVGVRNGSTLSLDNSTVDTGTEWMTILDSSILMAGNSSKINVGGVLHVQNESTVTLTNSDVDAENLWVEDAGSKVEITGGSLNARADIRIGNSDSPTGSLVLNGTTVTTGDLSVMGHLLANDSDIDAGDRFGGYGQDGTLAGVALTDSSLSTKGIDFNKSQHNYQNSTINARDSIWYWNSTVGQTGGVTEFADQMFLLDGTAMTVQGTESNHAVVRHQADASEDDNRGELIVDHSTLDLTYADVNLSSGDSGLLHVHTGGQLTAADSDLNGKKVIVETGGQIDMTGGSLTTNSLAVRSTSTFSATDAIINILGNTTTIDEGGSMVLNGGIYTEAGDLLVNGSLSGAAPVIHVGFDFLVADTATLAFTGPAEIFVGDDFINMLNSDLSQVIVHMLGTQDDDLPGDANEGSVFESLANIGRLIVETSLTLLDDLLVDQLVIDTGWEINLNGHSLVITESFIGSYDQIFGGSVTGPAPVPEPSTLVLVGGGLLGLVCLRRRK